MKVALRIEIKDAPMVVEADGSPEECATFLKLWISSFQPTEKVTGAS